MLQNLLNTDGFIFNGKFHTNHIQIGIFSVYYYAICIVTGMILCCLIAAPMFKRKGENPDLILDLMIAIVPSCIVGARLWYVIFDIKTFINAENPFLAIIDMDGMKQINDNYGHIEGDYALKKVREAIHHACPDAVIQARTGGDEFEIIAEDIAENEGVHYLEELVAYLDAFNESGGKEYDIHASYGYACRVPSQQDTMEIFIKESDEIMYRNKVINKINRGEALR